MVRQVKNVHANWSEQECGAPGKFSFQLILDNGAQEYAIRPQPRTSTYFWSCPKRARPSTST